MKTIKTHQKVGIAMALVATAVIATLVALPAKQSAQLPGSTKLVVENGMLTGLPAGALFPFIDSTPNAMASAHVTLTDATGICHHDNGTAPQNIVVLAGEAGGVLTSIMTPATNTGIGSSGQCVFHVTVTPGVGGVPRRMTDIVVVNAGPAPLTAYNTITVSAEVR